MQIVSLEELAGKLERQQPQIFWEQKIAADISIFSGVIGTNCLSLSEIARTE